MRCRKDEIRPNGAGLTESESARHRENGYPIGFGDSGSGQEQPTEKKDAPGLGAGWGDCLPGASRGRWRREAGVETHTVLTSNSKELRPAVKRKN